MTSEIARFDAITGLSCLLCTAVLLEVARAAGVQVLGTGTDLCLRRGAVVTSTSSDNTESHAFTPLLRSPFGCVFPACAVFIARQLRQGTCQCRFSTTSEWVCA